MAHLRGHETDRLAAPSPKSTDSGGHAEELPDGLRITPRHSSAADVASYHDHRMATFGAIIGCAFPGTRVGTSVPLRRRCLSSPPCGHSRPGGLAVSGRQLDEDDVGSNGMINSTVQQTTPAHGDAVDAFVTSPLTEAHHVCVVQRNPDAPGWLPSRRAGTSGRKAVTVGDDVGLVGDLSGRPDTLYSTRPESTRAEPN